MRQLSVTLYQFEELSPEAQQKAIEQAQTRDDLYGWDSEWQESLEAFCLHFGVTLRSWNVCPWGSVEYSEISVNEPFRGLKLKAFNPEHMPTGFCGDCAFWQPFYNEFKRTGDAKQAFNHAVYEGLKAWRDDHKSCYTEDSIREFLTCNEYEYTEDGKRY